MFLSKQMNGQKKYNYVFFQIIHDNIIWWKLFYITDLFGQNPPATGGLPSQKDQ